MARISLCITSRALWPALIWTASEKWKINLQEIYGKDTLWWDLGTSPVLADGKAIVAVMQDGDSYLVALDLKTGRCALEATSEI